MRKWKRQNGKRCGSQAGTDAEVRRTELWRSGGQRCENWVNRDVDIGLSIQLTHPVSKRRRIQIVFQINLGQFIFSACSFFRKHICNIPVRSSHDSVITSFNPS